MWSHGRDGEGRCEMSSEWAKFTEEIARLRGANRELEAEVARLKRWRHEHLQTAHYSTSEPPMVIDGFAPASSVTLPVRCAVQFELEDKD